MRVQLTGARVQEGRRDLEELLSLLYRRAGKLAQIAGDHHPVERRDDLRALDFLGREGELRLRLPELRASALYAERLPQWRTIYQFQVNASAAGQRTACEGILSLPTLTLGM